MSSKSFRYGLYGLASVIVIGLALVGFNYDNSKVISEQVFETNFVDTEITPQTTLVIPNEVKIEVSETVVTPEIYTAASDIPSTVSLTNTDFILPIFKSVDAFPSSQLTVTLDEWIVPTPSAGVDGISVDSIGNVYFTENNENKIGRLVPSTNVITEWTLPDTFSRPTYVSVDSNDDVFFAERDVNKIGRLS